MRALCTVFAALALTAAFLYTAGTSRAGEVPPSGVDSFALQQRSQVARSQRNHVEQVERQRRRAERRLARVVQRQQEAARKAVELAAWLAATAPPFRCPVAGPVDFVNSWGDARSGGRRHQGTDMMAAYGTPVVAPVAGVATTRSSAMGGITVELAGNDGVTYMGLHLSRLSGARGQVVSGTVLGYVGATGNASGGSPHLHFEKHPGGGGAVNPYPTVAQYC